MSDLRDPAPVQVLDLFPPERAALLGLLDDLDAEAWALPSPCPCWTVKDVALHLLADDFGTLSMLRDGHRGPVPRPDETLVPFLNRINEEWVSATRRFSPRVVCDLLRWTDGSTLDVFAELDPLTPGFTVSWASPDPAPWWLHVAREYTERWVHQQQIREAVGAPLLREPRFFAPVLATFARAFPRTFRDVEADPGTTVCVVMTGPSGSAWSVVRGDGDWSLRSGTLDTGAHALVTLDQDLAWRLFTRGVAPDAARDRVSIEGDRRLGEQVLTTVSIIA